MSPHLEPTAMDMICDLIERIDKLEKQIKEQHQRHTADVERLSYQVGLILGLIERQRQTIYEMSLKEHPK